MLNENKQEEYIRCIKKQEIELNRKIQTMFYLILVIIFTLIYGIIRFNILPYTNLIDCKSCTVIDELFFILIYSLISFVLILWFSFVFEEILKLKNKSNIYFNVESNTIIKAGEQIYSYNSNLITNSEEIKKIKKKIKSSNFEIDFKEDEIYYMIQYKNFGKLILFLCIFIPIIITVIIPGLFLTYLVLILSFFITVFVLIYYVKSGIFFVPPLSFVRFFKVEFKLLKYTDSEINYTIKINQISRNDFCNSPIKSRNNKNGNLICFGFDYLDI